MLGRHQHISDRCLFAQSTLRNVYGAHLWAASQLCCVKRLSPNPADWLISIIAGQDVITNLKVFDQLRPGQGRHNTVRTETRNDISTLAKRPEAATGRVLGYGKDYSFELNGEDQVLDLTELKDKELKEEHLLEKGKNEFSFTLPIIKKEITFKILTHLDEKKIEEEIKGRKKVKQEAGELTTRLKYMILSIDGDRERKNIREFVDTQLLARDSRALREYIKEISPDVDMTFDYEDENGEIQRGATVPLTINFLWPDA